MREERSEKLREWVADPCALSTINTRVQREGQKQTLLTALYGTYLCHTVTRILKVAWKAVKDVHAAELCKRGMRDEDGEAMCESLERIANVALQIPSVQNMYLAVRE